MYLDSLCLKARLNQLAILIEDFHYCILGNGHLDNTSQDQQIVPVTELGNTVPLSTDP